MRDEMMEPVRDQVEGLLIELTKDISHLELCTMPGTVSRRQADESNRIILDVPRLEHEFGTVKTRCLEIFKRLEQADQAEVFAAVAAADAAAAVPVAPVASILQAAAAIVRESGQRREAGAPHDCDSPSVSTPNDSVPGDSTPPPLVEGRLVRRRLDQDYD